MITINVDEWLQAAETIAFALGSIAFACLMFQVVAAGTRTALKQGLALLAILAGFLWWWIGGFEAAVAVTVVMAGWSVVAAATCEAPLREVLGGRWYGAKLVTLTWTVTVCSVFLILLASDYGF